MPNEHPAVLWHADDGKVRCELCAHGCAIAEGDTGLCRVRQNIGGTLCTLNYDRVVAANVDPIEKKPLFHYLPGTRSLSVAAPGCNFQCDFCQNWRISQSPRDGMMLDGQSIAPEQLVAAAESHRCASISYTYTEPTIFFELAKDTAELARRRGVGNCFVSNGYMTSKAVETIAPVLDAINVDLKAFRDETYKQVMGARLEPVLTCLRALVSAGVWVEVTTLVVPGLNDSTGELSDIAAFIARELGPQVPWHVSRFHGDYRRASGPATPVETLEQATRLGYEAGLKFVYCGNVAGHADESTRCPGCKRLLIERTGFQITSNHLADGQCPDCDEAIEGVWQPPGPSAS